MIALPADPLAEIVSKINTAVDLQLTPDEVTVMSLTPVVAGTKNTRAFLTSNDGRLQVGVTYRRIDIEPVIGKHSTTYPDGGESDSIELISKINARTGLTFNPNDFQSSPIDRGGGTVIAILKASSQSLLLVGECLIELV